MTSWIGSPSCLFNNQVYLSIQSAYFIGRAMSRHLIKNSLQSLPESLFLEFARIDSLSASSFTSTLLTSDDIASGRLSSKDASELSQRAGWEPRCPVDDQHSLRNKSMASRCTVFSRILECRIQLRAWCLRKSMKKGRSSSSSMILWMRLLLYFCLLISTLILHSIRDEFSSFLLSSRQFTKALMKFLARFLVSRFLVLSSSAESGLLKSCTLLEPPASVLSLRLRKEYSSLMVTTWELKRTMVTFSKVSPLFLQILLLMEILFSLEAAWSSSSTWLRYSHCMPFLKKVLTLTLWVARLSSSCSSGVMNVLNFIIYFTPIPNTFPPLHTNLSTPQMHHSLSQVHAHYLRHFIHLFLKRLAKHSQ